MIIKTTSRSVLDQWLESINRQGYIRVGNFTIDFSENGINVIDIDKEFGIYCVKKCESCQ
jgi:hypothetical protein